MLFFFFWLASYTHIVTLKSFHTVCVSIAHSFSVLNNISLCDYTAIVQPFIC